MRGSCSRIVANHWNRQEAGGGLDGTHDGPIWDKAPKESSVRDIGRRLVGAKPMRGNDLMEENKVARGLGHAMGP